MRLSKIILPILSITLVSIIVPRTPGAAQTNARRVAPGAGGPTVIFSLSKDIYGTFHIEPIVIISGGKYTAPPTETEAVAKKFSDSYFRTGRQYRVLFGGGDAGSLSVEKYEQDQCFNLVAEVGAQTTARLGGEVQALAVSSDNIVSGPGFRRVPTGGERASALEVAHAVYRRRGVSAALVRKMKTVNLTAIDIERDGKFELIGSFEIDAGNEVMHNLFVIFEPTAAEKYKAAWNWYHKTNLDGPEDRKLVDAFDLDGDGMAEIIVEGHTIENHDYAIYKRQSGTWRPVYKGGGGGAC